MTIKVEDLQQLVDELKTSNPLESVTEKLEQLIEANTTVKKWEPPVYSPYYLVHRNGIVAEYGRTTTGNRLYGVEFPTEESALLARDIDRLNHRILQYVLEQGEDGRYDRTAGRTYYITIYDAGRRATINAYGDNALGRIYMSRETAVKLNNDINSGIFEVWYANNNVIRV